YCNFSVFQSLPDSWAIGHIFPIMPVHRLSEAPGRNTILADITCDCDGKIDRFISMNEMNDTLPLHELKNNEEYYLGVFLVGAYQETLGDLHNLLGDTNVVSIRINENGEYDFVSEMEGDSVADVLSYVEYNPKILIEQFREKAEKAVREGKIDVSERRKIMKAYESGLIKKDTQTVVHNVSFSISRGETLGLVGECGSGKTTLGRLLLRLIEPTSGSILFNGQDITHLSRKKMRPYRKDMQIIFQDPESSLNPRMTIYQSIVEPLNLWTDLTLEEKDVKVHDLLDAVGLGVEHLNRYPYQLSGGQNQRVVLARILTLEPLFLVADEPTASLDVSVQAQILDIIARWKANHSLTLLFISHDLDLVRRISDRIITLESGQIISEEHKMSGEFSSPLFRLCT
ncbi:MAG: hypothetical protein CVV33_07680, partial [Methanomicrobiales archaeon HGW-Methanomicrobiales-4]